MCGLSLLSSVKEDGHDTFLPMLPKISVRLFAPVEKHIPGDTLGDTSSAEESGAHSGHLPAWARTRPR